MSTQQFCLKWNNYQSNMSDVFLSMLNNENMVDVTLACDGQNIKAHKMVLAACSPYFQTLFQTNPCKHPIVILKDVRFLDLRAIIDFMYRGEVNVGQDQLAALLKTAETLKGTCDRHTPVFTGFFIFFLVFVISVWCQLTLLLSFPLVIFFIHYLAVKGLAEVTEKQARGQVTSQHQQQPLFGTAVASNLSNILPPTPQTKKKRKRNNKNKGNDQEHHCPDPSESDEDGSAAKRTSEGIKGSRLNATQRMITAKQDTSPVEQMESSRILEQSMATAEVIEVLMNVVAQILNHRSVSCAGCGRREWTGRSLICFSSGWWSNGSYSFWRDCNSWKSGYRCHDDLCSWFFWGTRLVILTLLFSLNDEPWMESN